VKTLREAGNNLLVSLDVHGILLREGHDPLLWVNRGGQISTTIPPPPQ